MKSIKMMRICCLVAVLVLIVVTMAPAALASTGPVVYKANANVNVRKGPSTSYTSYGILNKGEIFNAYDISSTWYYGAPDIGTDLYDYYGWINGYVQSSYLDFVKIIS